MGVLLGSNLGCRPEESPRPILNPLHRPQESMMCWAVQKLLLIWLSHLHGSRSSQMKTRHTAGQYTSRINSWPQADRNFTSIVLSDNSEQRSPLTFYREGNRGSRSHRQGKEVGLQHCVPTLEVGTFSAPLDTYRRDLEKPV